MVLGVSRSGVGPRGEEVARPGGEDVVSVVDTCSGRNR